jgi:hypothetical protein
MEKYVLVIQLLLADGSMVPGQQYEYAGWRNRYLSTARECLTQAAIQSFYPTYGQVVGVFPYCERRIFY